MSDRKQIQKKHYDRQALQEESQNSSWEFDPDRHLLSSPYEFCKRWFLNRSLTGKMVLDYGCGARTISIEMLGRTGALITGVDISPESIRVAQKRALIGGRADYFTFQIGDCESLPYEEDLFDYVVSLGTLSCLELDIAYSEIARVLRPNGCFVVIETLGHNPLLNFNRWLKLKRGFKTTWSVDHILKLKHFQRANRYFNRVELIFFDLLTPFLVPFASMSRWYPRRVKETIWTLDERLLSLSHLKQYAFKIVGVFSEPRKNL